MSPHNSHSKRASRRWLGVTAAAALAVPASLIAVTPAHAALPESITFDTIGQNEWEVPAGVSTIDFVVRGGSGGSASGEHGGTGGLGAEVTGSFSVTSGDSMFVWVGAAGGDGGGTGGEPGLGGTGYATGGNGASSGNSARPGGGGGGSSAILYGADEIAVAGGGGGAGGRGRDDIGPIDACRGGDGGDAGSAGSSSWSNSATCSVQAGGAAGESAFTDGDSATDVSGGLNFLIGGSGGGGAGDGAAGQYSASGFNRTAGGGGGGGGASLGESVGVASEAGDGYVQFFYEVSYETTLALAADPEPRVIGEPVTVTATVVNTTTDAFPVGQVVFSHDGGELEIVDLMPGDVAGESVAVTTFADGTIGSYWVDANYQPADMTPFEASGNSIETNVEKGDSLLTVELEPASATYRDLVTATAEVSVVSPAVVPTLAGNVTFWRGDAFLGTVPVDGATGLAQLEFIAEPADNTPIYAAYTDSEVLNPSDTVVDFAVSAAATTTTLVAAPGSIEHGDKVTFTATVASEVDVQPTGLVQFYEGTTLIGEAAVSADGVATFSTTSLAAGTRQVTAQYVSDTVNFLDSASSEVSVTVTAKPGSSIATAGAEGVLPLSIGGASLLLLGAGVYLIGRRKRVTS